MGGCCVGEDQWTVLFGGWMGGFIILAASNKLVLEIRPRTVLTLLWISPRRRSDCSVWMGRETRSGETDRQSSQPSFPWLFIPSQADPSPVRDEKERGWVCALLVTVSIDTSE